MIPFLTAIGNRICQQFLPQSHTPEIRMYQEPFQLCGIAGMPNDCNRGYDLIAMQGKVYLGLYASRNSPKFLVTLVSNSRL